MREEKRNPGFPREGMRRLKNFFAKSILISSILLLSGPKLLEAQSFMQKDPMELYIRFLPDQEPFSGHYFSFRTPSLDIPPDTLFTDLHPWQNRPYFLDFKEPLVQFNRFSLDLIAPELMVSHNNEIPSGGNDGPLWQGRGWNHSLSTGLRLQTGVVTLTLRPRYVYSENRKFELSHVPVHPGLSEFAQPLTWADLPLRFGENALSRLDPGDSSMEVSIHGIKTGISTERMWSSPGIHNSLLFSYHAPGFLHYHIGTAEPVVTRYGTLFGRAFWGGLRESDWFDKDPTNNLRLISGLHLSFSPRFTDGLTLGLNRAAVSPWGESPAFSDLFNVLKRNPPRAENPEDPAYHEARLIKSSVFARWAFPDAGFEAYTEWGRSDYRRPIRDLLGEPELNRAYILGVLKRITLSAHHYFIINPEVTNLKNSSKGSELRETPIWYTREEVPQGFTHRGQVLGAAIGPGSGQQSLTIAYLNPYGMAGASAARIAHNYDRHYQHKDFYLGLDFPGALLTSRHELEIRYGGFLFLNLPAGLELQADYEYSRIDNRYSPPRRTAMTNHRFALTLRAHFPGWIR